MAGLIGNMKRAALRGVRKVNEKRWERAFLSSRPDFSSNLYKEVSASVASQENEAKFATFVYNETNVGDDIQTIAQLGVLPKANDIIAFNRDYVASYRGSKRVFLMNGWFGQFPWPPSEEVDPIFISFHAAHAGLISEELFSYYKKHEPIGCRDKATVENFRSIGIDAYFSGCLTLTLNNPYSDAEREGYVVIVDAHLGDAGSYPPSTPELLHKLVPASIIKNAILIEQEVSSKYNNNYVYKTNKAIGLLELYSKARLVITTRLHCALPCLALGTPVVFMHQSYETDKRFDGYREILKGFSPSAVSADINWDSPSPANITTLREKVRNDVKSRITEKIKTY